MKLMKLVFLGILIASLGIITSCSNDKNPTEASSAKVYPVVNNYRPIGNRPADFVWEVNGKQVKFSEYTKSKYVLLNFWGTWCPPCKAELPDIISIAKEMENKDLVVLGVALERVETMKEAVQQVSEFWTEKQMHYPVVIGTMELTNAYGGINAVPTTFLIDKNGEIFTSFEGMRSKADFMNEINKMMNK